MTRKVDRLGDFSINHQAANEHLACPNFPRPQLFHELSRPYHDSKCDRWMVARGCD